MRRIWGRLCFLDDVRRDWLRKDVMTVVAASPLRVCLPAHKRTKFNPVDSLSAAEE